MANSPSFFQVAVIAREPRSFIEDDAGFLLSVILALKELCALWGSVKSLSDSSPCKLSSDEILKRAHSHFHFRAQ